MRRRSRILLSLLLLSLAGADAFATTRFAPTLDAARAESARSGRPMLLVYGTSWCGWCRKMDREALSDPRFAARAETDFVVVKVDAEDGGAGAASARMHRVRSFPTLVLADSTGRALARMSGFRTADALLRDLTLASSAGPVSAASDGEGALAMPRPRDAKAMADIALELERTGREEEALRQWQSVAGVGGVHPATRELALWRIVALAGNSGDRCAKVEALATIVRDFPNSARLEEALYELGATHVLMGNRDDAVAVFERLMARFPDGRYAASAAGELARFGASRAARSSR